MQRGAVVIAVLFLATAPVVHADDLPTIDSVFPPTVRVTALGLGFTIDRLAVDSGDVTWLSLHVSTSGTRRKAELQIDVPAGTRVIGMALERDGVTMWGAALGATRARRLYHAGSAPALVAWEGTSAGDDHVRVTVDEVARDAPATITLAVVLPIAKVGIAPVRRFLLSAKQRAPAIVIDGKTRSRGPAEIIHVVDQRATDFAHVDEDTSLFVDTVASDRAPVIVLGGMDGDWHEGMNKRTIRRTIKYQVPRLRYCYEQVVQRWPLAQKPLEGKVELHFVIEVDGTVAPNVEVGGELTNGDLRACLAREVASWNFGEDGDGRVIVHYPITFELSSD